MNRAGVKYLRVNCKFILDPLFIRFIYFYKLLSFNKTIPRDIYCILTFND